MNEQVVLYTRPDDQATATHWRVLAIVVILGAVLRFWGLGNIGLHGDEDVMGMATRALLQTGWPVLPSGMEYVRALPHTYLMAGSTYLFGDTEWALRLPSAVVGTFAILVGYWLARRFLSANWSIVFALVIALLPSLITVSQTARMYIFYVALVMLLAIAVFRWERTESLFAYGLAFVACLAAMAFHALSVFSVFLFLYPGLVRSSWRLLALGGVAFVVCVAFQQAHSEWVGSHYFDLVKISSESDGGEPALVKKVPLAAGFLGILMVSLVTGIGYLSARRRHMPPRKAFWLALSIACLASAVILAYLVQYHVAGIAYLLGAILFVRAGFRVVVPVALGVVLLLMFSAHAYVSWQLPQVQSAYDLLERLAGLGYPKTYLTFAFFAPAAVLIYGVVAAYFFVQFALGRPLPDHVLLFLLTVFAPLFLMGFLSGQYVPARYVIGFLPFFVLVAFAGVSDLVGRFGDRVVAKKPVVPVAIVAILVLSFVSIRDLRYNVNPQNSSFRHLTDHRGVDHQGAAQYVRSQDLGPEDVVIAIDTQQQVYYLRDRIDYYLRALKDSRNSSFLRGDQMLCLYTGVPQISTGDELSAVLSVAKDREIFIIGSGELDAGNRVRNLGDGIWETMQEFGVEEVYRGRDGATRVWKYTAHESDGDPAAG